MFARKLGYFRPNAEHPINAVWARFSGVKEWDSYEWRQRFPDYAENCLTAREWATNHLFGRGWWVWIIPLQGGDVSAGIVYDSRIFKFPEGPTLGQRLHTHILSNPVGREIFGTAKVIEGDVHALSMLPYHSEKVCGDGWAAVGDAAGFIDPMTGDGLRFAVIGAELAAHVALGTLAHRVRAPHRTLARMRRDEFAGKWRFNRVLRRVVGSGPALDFAGVAALTAPVLLRRTIAYAGDLPKP